MFQAFRGTALNKTDESPHPPKTFIPVCGEKVASDITTYLEYKACWKYYVEKGRQERGLGSTMGWDVVYFILFFWLCSIPCGTLVPQPEIKLISCAMEA